MSEEAERGKLGLTLGCAAGYQNGRLGLELHWRAENGETGSTVVWMTPGQALETVERIARTARLLLRDRVG